MEARPSTARPEEFDEFDTYAPEYDDAPQGDRTVAAIAHFSSLVGFGLLAPIVIYLLKRDESAFVAHHAREAINFHLTTILAVVLSIPLIALFGLGILTLIGTMVAVLVYGIIAGVRALDGDWYDYPLTIRFLS
jgi:uncharacterized Tic20 family protein